MIDALIFILIGANIGAILMIARDAIEERMDD